MKPTNRLAREKSPYLLQHAHNPVDWFPWGEEAFARARAEGKPIFLSVGYATCHWCHVMERESFENEDIAALMNELFVNVKVDREEHPDVDQIYMAAVQRISGQGGWPMSVFMTPDLKPFYAGTYYPPESRYGRPGFPDLLRRIASFYGERREEIEAQADQLVEMIGETSDPGGVAPPVDRAPLAAAATELARGFDPTWGGFGRAPKFPRPMTLMLLLRERLAAGDPDGSKLGMVETTLEMMWRGGMYDHVGGGFARYSVDDEWLVPHFEKMLYDNALLAIAYLEAWQVTGREDWRRVLRETFDWVAREMTHAEGAFFSALDADSEGEEGKFYVWTPSELVAALGEDDAAFAAAVFDVTEPGNFEGANVLALRRDLAASATALGVDRDALETRLADVRERLREAREARPRPLLDDKVLTSWNGLMIAALARAGAAMEEADWLERARRAADFVLRELHGADGLQRRWRDGEAALPATLEDHAFLGWGLMELFEASGEARWLEAAEAILREGVAGFEDADRGGFFMSPTDAPHLVVRMKDAYDGATPSGNSAMTFALVRLADALGDEDLRAVARRAVDAFAPELARHPGAYPLLLCALDQLLEPPAQTLLALGEDADANEDARRELRAGFDPRTLRLALDGPALSALAGRMPWLAGKEAREGRPTLWACRDFRCEAPRVR